MDARAASPGLLSDLIEERAAIIQEGEGCTRGQAEHRAAQLYGFSSWAAWIERKTASKGN